MPRSHRASAAIAAAALLTAAPAAARTITLDIAVGKDVVVDASSRGLEEGERLSFSSSFARDPLPVDILFLSDTTGSMGRLTNAAAREADEIVARTATLGDVAWGVGSYRDFPTAPWGGQSDYPFQLDQALTEDPGEAAAGLRSWFPSGGADRKESGLFALQQLAADPATGFRPGSDRYLLWFGDQPSHDPLDTPGYPGPTLDETIAALTAADITVLGVDVGNLNGDGELFQVVDATGGSIGRLEGRLSDIVFNSLFEVIAPRADVSLDVELLSATGDPIFTYAGVLGDLAPGGYSITLDADPRFDPGDGGLAPIPVPASMPLLLAGVGGLVLMRRGRRGAKVSAE